MKEAQGELEGTGYRGGKARAKLWNGQTEALITDRLLPRIPWGTFQIQSRVSRFPDLGVILWLSVAIGWLLNFEPDAL